jgi:hypothetical protein
MRHTIPHNLRQAPRSKLKFDEVTPILDFQWLFLAKPPRMDMIRMEWYNYKNYPQDLKTV